MFFLEMGCATVVGHDLGDFVTIETLTALIGLYSAENATCLELNPNA